MFAVLHVADFALQAVLRIEPGAQRRAAALFSAATKKSVVIAANPAARTFAVEPGMTAPQALARCAALLIRAPNAAAETDAQAALHAVAFTVSPSIEDTAPGVCTIDLRGIDPAERKRNAARAVGQLEQLGFVASAGIGSTPLLALYAARTASPRAPDCNLTAVGPKAMTNNSTITDTMAADSTVRTVTDPTAFLAGLPLSAADPSPEIANILLSWGLRTLGELTALSRDDIGRRLGPDGLAVWDRANGGRLRPLHLILPAQTFTAAMEFEDEIETMEPLLFILRRFLERLGLELVTSSYVAAELELTLTLADDQIQSRPFRLPEPTADIDTLFRTLHTYLEGLRTDTPIAGVQLRITPARPLVRQQGLFDTGLKDPHGFAETLARIVAIVGGDRLGTPQREDTHRPDAVKLEPPRTVIPPPANPPLHCALGLPLRRFRPALAAQLELTDGKPTYVWTDRFNGAITEIRGPWLSSGDWWEASRTWRRTEYDIALAKGGLYRLVLTDRRWLIEGEYD
jgi:protein ImuB